MTNLDWSAGSLPGCSLPASLIKTVSILIEGDASGTVDIDAIEYLRSGPLRPHVSENCVLGGRIEGSLVGIRIVLEYEGPSGEKVIRDDAQVDGSGLFAFTGVPRNRVVELYAESDGSRFNPSNGPLIGVNGDLLEAVIRIQNRD